MASLSSAVEALQSSLNIGVPHCIGTRPLSKNQSSLFFRTLDGRSSFVDFRNIEDAALEELALACKPASFGKGAEEILDDSIRKAGKLDLDKFATLFTPIGTDIVDTVYDHFAFSISKGGSGYRYELYKLNVYGPGSFFKSHVDTPRSDNMIGSLVVVFPTPHAGGGLRFRKGERVWDFDSATSIANCQEPSVAWVAFPGDLEHEVLPVESGYRVTLTYNIYFDSEPPPMTFGHLREKRRLAIAQAFDALYRRDDFMPFGGYVGFGLAHRYTLNIDSPGPLTDLLPLLKGQDADLVDVLQGIFGIRPVLKAGYQDSHCDDIWAFADKYVGDFAGWEDISMFNRLREWTSIQVFRLAKNCAEVSLPRSSGGQGGDDESDEDDESDDDDDNPSRVIFFFTPLVKCNDIHEEFLIHHMGNEPGMANFYGSFCLLAKVPPVGQRDKVD